MRIRRRLAAGTAVVFAALAVLSSAPAASAVTIGGRQLLPLSVLASLGGVAQLPPVRPVGVKVTPAYSSLVVSWGAVTADPAVTGYKVQVLGSPKITGSPFAAGATATSAVVSGLEPATTYTVSVSATNSLADSPYSMSATAKTLATIKYVASSVTAQVVLAEPVPGTITLEVPSLGAVHLGTAVQQADGTFTAAGKIGATVTDARPPFEQTYWNLQATVADFTATSGGAKFSSAQLRSAVPTLTASTPNALVTVGPAYQLGSQPGSRQLADGVKGASGTVNADLSLVVPKYTAEGSYTSVITMDLVKS
jgi:Fibronectin type III domain